MLFVLINFSLEKDSVVFSAFVNYNIMLCIEFSSLKGLGHAIFDNLSIDQMVIELTEITK